MRLNQRRPVARSDADAGSRSTQARAITGSERLAAQRQALQAAFGPAAQLQPADAEGVVQRVNMYAAALLDTDYHDHKKPADRLPEFAKVKVAVRAAARILIPHRTRLNAFLQQLDLQPNPANPLSRKIAELNLLVTGTLDTKPTPTRWQAVKDAEEALVGQDSDTFVAASFEHEKARLKAALRKMRVDTFGTREHILTQLGDGNWMNPGQRAAVVILRGLKDEVLALMATLDTAADYTAWESMPARLVELEQSARDATDGPFADALAGGWNEVAAEEPNPRAAALYFEAHILERHRQSSNAAGAGKFSTNDWAVIRGRINTALANGTLSGPHFNVADGKPLGRFEITHDSGAAMGLNINGGATNRIFVVVTRSGKTVVTAYPY